MEIKVSILSLDSLWVWGFMAHLYLLLIEMYTHRRHLFSCMHLLDLKRENNKGKAMVREFGVYVFSVTTFDFGKASHSCQAPMLLPQGDPGLKCSPPIDEGWWERRHRGPLAFYYD